MTAPNVQTPGGNRASANQNTDDTQIIGAASFCGNPVADDKAEKSMQARAAMAGCGLYRLADGDFLLTRWGMAKTCPDLRSVSALLDRLAGAA